MKKPGPQSDDANEQQDPEAQEQPRIDQQIESLKGECDDLLARLQRVSADYLNYQKRVQREINDARDYANEALIKCFLPIIDDIDRVLAAARENHAEDDPLLVGMQMVHDKALDALGKFGLAPIEAMDMPFDPDKHLAVMQEPSQTHSPMTIVRELAKGYVLKGRTIRPSSVIVSKAPEEEPEDD